MPDITPPSHNPVFLTDGAFDEARARGITSVMLNDELVQDTAEQLGLPTIFLPTLAVVGLVTDGSCRHIEYRSKLEEADPPTFVGGSLLHEEAPPTTDSLSQEAHILGCKTITLLSIRSLLEGADHYTTLVDGLVTMRFAEDVGRRERMLLRHEGKVTDIKINPILNPRGAIAEKAKEIRDNTPATSPLIVTQRPR